MKIIENFTEHLECPLVDGIIFPDETIQLLNIQIDWMPAVNYTVVVGSKTSIKILDEKGKLWWSNCAVMAVLIDTEHALEVIAGEGNYGSDGFVCVIDLNSRKMLWLAYLTCSNPFKQIKIYKDELFAISTIDYVWKFKLNNPVDCLVLRYTDIALPLH